MIHFAVTRPMPFAHEVRVVRSLTLADLVYEVSAAMALAEEIALAYFGRWNGPRVRRVTWTDERHHVWYALTYDGAPFWLAEVDACEARLWWVVSSPATTGPYR